MENKLDLLLIGATGFVGRSVAIKLALLSKEADIKDVKWGIAARSSEKMDALIRDMEKLGINTVGIERMVCDVTHQESLYEACARASIILNATGPNVDLSPPIVKACVQSGTHYVDISAERYHLVTLLRDFDKAAEAAGTLIVPACGFATIPVTAGVLLLEDHYNGNLQSIKCYTEVSLPIRAFFPFPGYNNSLIHYGTWASLVHELGSFKKYLELKKQVSEPVSEKRSNPFFHWRNGKLWYLYPGPEQEILDQARIYNAENGRNIYDFDIYTTMPYFILFLSMPVFFLYYFLCKFIWFSNLLLRFPKLFTIGLASKEGPTEKMRSKTGFCFTLTGKGRSSDDTMTVKISGIDPNVEATCTALVFAAITILRERSKMPKGGVLPAPAVFSGTQLVNLLQNGGLEFEFENNYPNCVINT